MSKYPYIFGKCKQCGSMTCDSMRDDQGYQPCKGKGTKMVLNASGGWDEVQK